MVRARKFVGGGPRGSLAAFAEFKSFGAAVIRMIVRLCPLARAYGFKIGNA